MDRFNRLMAKGETIIFLVLQIISGALMAMLVVIVLYSVFCRYVLNASLAWAEELSRYLMINMVCCAAVSAYIKNEHLGLDILVRHLPRKLQGIVWLIRQGLMMFASAFLALGGYEMLVTVFGTLSAALRLRMEIVYTILPGFAILLFIITLERTIQRLAYLCAGKEDLLW